QRGAQLRTDPVADALGILAQALLRNGIQGRQTSRTGQRIAAESRTVLAIGQNLGSRAPGQTGSDWYTRPQALGQGHDVRYDIRVLEREPGTGTSDTALHF